MPNKYRQGYEFYRNRLLAARPFCERCGSPNKPYSSWLSYHHLIPRCLITDHRYGILLCRKCHPIVLAEQRLEFRRIGIDGYPVYPYDPVEAHKQGHPLGHQQRLEILKLWLKTCSTAPADYVL